VLVLVLEWCERKTLQAGQWLLLEWCERKTLLAGARAEQGDRAFTEIVSYNQNLAVCNFVSLYAFNVSYTRSHQPQVQNYNAAICQLGIVQRILHIQMKQYRLQPRVISRPINGVLQQTGSVQEA